MTPVETALRRLWAAMRSAGVEHAEVEHQGFGKLVAEVIAPAFEAEPSDEVCPCGHLLAEEHSGGGCLLGCSDSRCNTREATVSQLEREVFAPIFTARSK